MVTGVSTDLSLPLSGGRSCQVHCSQSSPVVLSYVSMSGRYIKFGVLLQEQQGVKWVI